jgi:predicted AlkP superfamily pyrophosphatase or phosphodiesterase
MPFLASFPFKRRIKSEHGYSIACHASMYSGVHPDVHKLWFVWKYSPMTSPFHKFRYLLHIPFMSSLPGKYFLHRMSKLFLSERNTSFFGIPRFVHIPTPYLQYLDVSEKRNYDEPGYLAEVPGIFDILRERDIPFCVIGMDKSEREESKILARVVFRRAHPWMYWFMGDVDHFSHAYGQTSIEAIRRLAELDSLLERKYAELVESVGDVDFLLWSDHGHIPVDKRIDLYRIFDNAGVSLNRFFHVIDATYVRFWFLKDDDAYVVRSVLEYLASDGTILEVDDQRRYHVYPGDNRFGDLVFSLNPGRIFSKTIWGWSRKMLSMHGYNPDLPENDGVLLTNLPVVSHRKLELVDIAPSIIEKFGVLEKSHMEGKSFWK